MKKVFQDVVIKEVYPCADGGGGITVEGKFGSKETCNLFLDGLTKKKFHIAPIGNGEITICKRHGIELYVYDDMKFICRKASEEEIIKIFEKILGDDIK